MRAKELMIGDWIEDLFNQRKGKVCKLYSAGIVFINIPDVKIKKAKWAQAPNPIHLTEEILKANGWQLLSNYGREAYYAPNGVFSLDFINGLFRLIIHGNIVIIKYVHELQHALRLCGLNELADNFKV